MGLERTNPNRFHAAATTSPEIMLMAIVGIGIKFILFYLIKLNLKKIILPMVFSYPLAIITLTHQRME